MSVVVIDFKIYFAKELNALQSLVDSGHHAGVVFCERLPRAQFSKNYLNQN